MKALASQRDDVGSFHDFGGILDVLDWIWAGDSNAQQYETGLLFHTDTNTDTKYSDLWSYVVVYVVRSIFYHSHHTTAQEHKKDGDVM